MKWSEEIFKYYGYLLLNGCVYDTTVLSRINGCIVFPRYYGLFIYKEHGYILYLYFVCLLQQNYCILDLKNGCINWWLIATVFGLDTEFWDMSQRLLSLIISLHYQLWRLMNFELCLRGFCPSIHRYVTIVTDTTVWWTAVSKVFFHYLLLIVTETAGLWTIVLKHLKMAAFMLHFFNVS